MEGASSELTALPGFPLPDLEAACQPGLSHKGLETAFRGGKGKNRKSSQHPSLSSRTTMQPRVNCLSSSHPRRYVLSSTPTFLRHLHRCHSRDSME